MLDDDISDNEDDAMLAQIIANKEFIVPKEAKLLGVDADSKGDSIGKDYLTEDEDFDVDTDDLRRVNRWSIVKIFAGFSTWLSSLTWRKNSPEPLRRSNRYFLIIY